MKTLSSAAPEPKLCAPLNGVRFPQPPLPQISRTPITSPRQNAAPVVPSLPQDDGEQRSPGISREEGVSQFLHIYEDVIVAAHTLRAALDNFARTIPALQQASFQEWMQRHEDELRAIGQDFAEVCDELVPGGPAAFGLDVPFFNPFEPFPLPDGSDQTKPVSDTLTPVSPEWSGNRQK